MLSSSHPLTPDHSFVFNLGFGKTEFLGQSSPSLGSRRFNWLCERERLWDSHPSSNKCLTRSPPFHVFLLISYHMHCLPRLKILCITDMQFLFFSLDLPPHLTLYFLLSFLHHSLHDQRLLLGETSWLHSSLYLVIDPPPVFFFSRLKSVLWCCGDEITNFCQEKEKTNMPHKWMKEDE